jgi:hypothetical protein
MHCYRRAGLRVCVCSSTCIECCSTAAVLAKLHCWHRHSAGCLHTTQAEQVWPPDALLQQQLLSRSAGTIYMYISSCLPAPTACATSDTKDIEHVFKIRCIWRPEGNRRRRQRKAAAHQTKCVPLGQGQRDSIADTEVPLVVLFRS